MNTLKTLFFTLFFCLLLISTGWTQNNETIPVTNRPINNSEEIFRFAIVSDRTGGMRGGIFENAISKVEMMQPEFVLSVGDLIDGYTEDPNVWNAQWDEFDEIIQKLSMPFYYVPGNHDTSNELLTVVWRKRHGRDYYHFKYKDVLFIAINTDEIENGGIDKPQIEYFKKVLSENEEVKWTLIFMHRPLWSYGNTQGYSEIEKALGSRNYTLFSGHHHHYRYKVHNGMEHFTLATTGGGSWMRNPEVGELDHITWVTMKEDGPKVAHIDINGIYSKDLVPDADYEDIQVLRQGNWLDIEPIVNETNSFTELPITFNFKNDSQRNLTIEGILENQHGITFKPRVLNAIIEKGTSKKVTVKGISIDGETSISQLNNSPLSFEISAGFERDVRKDIKLSASQRLLLDWKHRLTEVKNKIKIDGELSDWDDENWIEVYNPQFVKEDWDWKGIDDGKFEFKVNHLDDDLYLVVKFMDDRLIIDRCKILPREDKFFIHLSSKSKPIEFKTLELSLGNSTDSPNINSANSNINEFKAAISELSGTQILEIKIPFEEISESEKLDSIRLNIGIMDHDRPENTKPSIIWWRPIWGTDLDYAGSGFFTLVK